MHKTLKAALAACAVSALALVPVAGVATFAFPTVAEANNGKGGGNGGGGGREGRGHSGNRSGEAQGNSGNARADAGGKRGAGASSAGTSRSAGARGGASNRGGGLGALFRGHGERETRMSRASNGNRGAAASARRGPPTERAVLSSPRPQSRGAIASELKWLNAANASLNAYANASPSSRLGQIASYREALLDHAAAANDPAYHAELDGYRAALAAFAPDATAEQIDAALAAIQALDSTGEASEGALDGILAGLNPDAFAPAEPLAEGEVPSTNDPLADLRSALAGAILSDNALNDLDAARDAAWATISAGLTIAEGGAAWNHFHDLLRLHQPLPEKGDGRDVTAIPGDAEPIREADAGADPVERDDPRLVLTSAD